MVRVSNAQRCVLRLAVVLALVAGAASVVDAATASWDPNSEPDVAGYKLSYGTESGVHTTTIDVGNVTSYQFNPAPGKRYYVVVQAYNTAGGLSDKSAEAIIDIPSPEGTPPAGSTPGGVAPSPGGVAPSPGGVAPSPLDIAVDFGPSGLWLNYAVGRVATD